MTEGVTLQRLPFASVRTFLENVLSLFRSPQSKTILLLSVANAVDFQPTAEVPALQYFERVEPNTPADRAGIKNGDYLLEVSRLF